MVQPRKLAPSITRDREFLANQDLYANTATPLATCTSIRSMPKATWSRTSNYPCSIYGNSKLCKGAMLYIIEPNAIWSPEGSHPMERQQSRVVDALLALQHCQHSPDVAIPASPRTNAVTPQIRTDAAQESSFCGFKWLIGMTICATRMLAAGTW